MKTKIIIYTLAAMLLASCSSPWSIKNTADISFSVDLTSVRENTAPFKTIQGDSNLFGEDKDDAGMVKVSLFDAQTEKEIISKTEYFTDDDDLISITFEKLEIVGKTVYARVHFEDEDSVYTGTSEAKVMGEGINVLHVKLEEADSPFGAIVLESIIGNKVDSTVGRAATESIDLSEENPSTNVRFHADDIFESEKRDMAVKTMIESSFVEKLYDEFQVTIKKVENTNVNDIVVTQGSSPSVTFTAVAPNGRFFYNEDGVETTEKLVTIALTNDYNAFEGVSKIESSEININYGVPNITNALILGNSAWSIDYGLENHGVKKIMAKENSGVSVSDIANAFAVKFEAVGNVSSKFIYSNIGSIDSSGNTGNIEVPVILTSTGNNLFDNGTNTKTILLSVLFEEGEYTVDNSNFVETVDALSDPEIINILADPDGLILLQITEDIRKAVPDGDAFEFTSHNINLKVKLVAAKGGDFDISGGSITTSLIVSGANTTVTVGDGITITEGYAEAGGVIIRDGARFILDGGIIEGNESTVQDFNKGGGAVNVLHGTFEMLSGIIRDNQAYRGAGVFVYSETSQPSTFIMKGGSIEHNTTVVKNEGTGPGNNISGGGSGVYVYGSNSSFIMGEEGVSYTNETIPTIRGNSASRMGSAITISSNASVTINDGLITENIGPYGVIGSAAGGHFTMKNGSIIDNTYGPLNSDGTPNTDYIGNNDTSAIQAWVNGDINGIVENFSGSYLKTNITGGTIEGYDSL